MTWVDLSSAFAYGSSPTSTQLQNLRDNLAALAAADSGAPQIQTAGLANSAITSAKIAAANVNTSKLKTSGGSVSGILSVANVTDSISLQDYCFAVNMCAPSPLSIWTYPSIIANYTARFLLSCYWAGDYWGTNYAVYYRYVTASDRPFIYAIQDANGEFISVWESDDPPPDYWGLDKKPDGFKAPVMKFDKDFKVIQPYREIIMFNADKEFISEIRGKAHTDKKSFAGILNAYDFTGAIFEPKTLLEV